MEVFVIFIPPLVALIIGGWAIIAPRPVDTKVESIRLDQHIAWLEERLTHARERNWDEQMLASLQAQLAAAYRQRQELAG